MDDKHLSRKDEPQTQFTTKVEKIERQVDLLQSEPSSRREIVAPPQPQERDADKLERDITKPRTGLRAINVLDLLASAQPKFLSDTSAFKGVRVNPSAVQHNWPAPTIKRNHATIPFPTPITAEATTEEISTPSGVPKITFFLSDASTTEDEVVSNKVLVADGKINGGYPSGMPSGNTYILDLDDPADSLIYAGITFNPTTLAETSRFLGVSGSGDFPESRVEDATNGFAYWLLGFTYFDGDVFTVVNTRVGDVNFAFAYGATNGKPGLLPIDSAPGWIDLEALEA